MLRAAVLVGLVPPRFDRGPRQTSNGKRKWPTRINAYHERVSTRINFSEINVSTVTDRRVPRRY
eukprot:483241-Prymnesium_polylepis.1